MISDLRTYLKAALVDSDSNFKEHKDGFNSENIPSSLLNKSFFISYGALSNNVTENGFIDSDLPMTVRLYFKGYSTVQETLDKGMDSAYKFMRTAVNPARWTTLVKHFEGVRIDSQPLPTNDNSILIELEFNARIISTAL